MKRISLFIFALAVFLRFYRLPELTTFLSDQGRDAIVIKRIVTLSHLPAIGAASSVGQVYLGPFYYYLIAPFLLLFNFNPVGLAFGVTLFSIVGIFLSYLIVKNEFDIKTAFLFLICIAFSSVNIEVSRFSWNPNLLPFFSFLTLYFFYKLLKTNKLLFAVLFGTFFSFSLQLHYLAALLILPILFFTILHFLQSKKNQLVSLFLNFFISIFSFLFFISPLFIFDFRHNFLNIKNFIKLFTEQGVLSRASLVSRFSETIQSFFSHFMSNQIALPIALFLFFSFGLIYILFLKKRIPLFLNIHFVNVFAYLLGFSLLNSARHPHYFHSIYLSFFLILVYLLNILITKSKSKLALGVVVIFFATYIGLNLKSSYAFFRKPSDQIKLAQTIADFLAEKIDNKPFNVATWPVEFFEDQYLYFLELKGLIPADRSKLQITDQMFVLCNKEPCQIINSPSWNISMFGKAKIDTIWTVEGIKIYKLIHEN